MKCIKAIFLALFQLTTIFAVEASLISNGLTDQLLTGNNDENHRLKITYPSSNRQVVVHYHHLQSNIQNMILLDLGSDEKVVSAQEEASSFLKRYQEYFDEEKLNSIISDLSLFKYLSPGKNVFHLGLTKDRPFYRNSRIGVIEFDNFKLHFYYGHSFDGERKGVILYVDSQISENFSIAKVGRDYLLKREGRGIAYVSFHSDIKSFAVQYVDYVDENKSIARQHFLVLADNNIAKTKERNFEQGVLKGHLKQTRGEIEHRAVWEGVSGEGFLEILDENDLAKRLSRYGENLPDLSDNYYLKHLNQCFLSSVFSPASLSTKEINKLLREGCLREFDFLALSSLKYYKFTHDFKMDDIISKQRFHNQLISCLEKENLKYVLNGAAFFTSSFWNSTNWEDSFSLCLIKNHSSLLRAEVVSLFEDLKMFSAKNKETILDDLLSGCIARPLECRQNVEFFRFSANSIEALFQKHVELNLTDEYFNDIECMNARECLYTTFEQLLVEFKREIGLEVIQMSSLLSGRYRQYRALASTTETIERVEDTLRDCTQQMILDHGAEYFFSGLNQNMHHCSLELLKEVAVIQFENILYDIVSHFGVNYQDYHYQRSINSSVEQFRNFSRRVQSLGALEQEIFDSLIEAVGQFIAQVVLIEGDRYLTADVQGFEELNFARTARGEIEVFIAQSSSMPLGIALSNQLQYNTDGLNVDQIYRSSQSIIQDFWQHLFKWHSRLKLRSINRSLTNELVVENLEAEIENCFADIDGMFGLSFQIEQCRHLLDWKVSYELKRNEIREKIANHYPYGSAQYSDLKLITSSLTRCYQYFTESRTSFSLTSKQWIEGCENLVDFDLSLQLIQSLSLDYSRFLGARTGFRLYDSYLKCLRSSAPGLTKNDRIHNILHSQMLSFSPEEIMIHYFNLESQFSDTHLSAAIIELFTTNRTNLITSCEQTFADNVISQMRHFLIGIFPEDRIEGPDSQSYRQIMARVLDPELVELFVEFTQIHSDDQGHLQFPHWRTDRFIITPLGAQIAFRNLVETLVELISQGIIFDHQALYRELIIFREELKDAFLWLNQSDREVTAEELREFFTSSQVADYLVLADISQIIKRRMLQYLDQMKSHEIALFRSATRYRSLSRLTRRQRERYGEIIEKYRDLEELVELMTQSYDFRRLLRTSQRSGQELLSRLKENYMLPHLFGLNHLSEQERREVDLQVARFVISDDSLGGFAEQFVEHFAVEHLSQRRRDTWAIVRFLFYKRDAFDWSALKQTPSGRQAIRYYANYILLPSMLDVTFSASAQERHQDQFEDLVRQAQREL